MKNAILKSSVLGPVQTNCYFLQNKKTQEIIIVDPADCPEAIVRRIQEMQGVPAAILLTHGHFDHIGAAQAIRDEYQIPMYACEAEKAMLEDPEINLTAMYASQVSLRPERMLSDLDQVLIGGFSVQMIATPGHTPGSCCYYIAEEELLFSGDTLFCESVGRTDLPGGSSMKIMESLQRLLDLPEETSVCPGHGSITSIGHEKRYNPFA